MTLRGLFLFEIMKEKGELFNFPSIKYLDMLLWFPFGPLGFFELVITTPQKYIQKQYGLYHSQPVYPDIICILTGVV